MSIYFHHIGRKGAVDFDKTLRKPILMSYIQQFLASDQQWLIDDLREQYRSEEAYCWGIPSGGTSAIQHLKPGDYVFLIHYLQRLYSDGPFEGPIPLVLKVVYYSPSMIAEDFTSLSKGLWNSSNFPKVFFVTPVEIEITWGEFCEALDYKQTYNPTGNIYRVSDEKISQAGGEERALKRILKAQYNITMSKFEAFTALDGSIPYGEMNEEITELIKISDPAIIPDPNLTTDYELDEAKRKKRDSAFSFVIGRIYGHSCAVCGMKLSSKDGKRHEAEAAHIYPVDRNGSDDLRNGICLCRMHHWAFDEGLFFIEKNFTVRSNSSYSNISKYEGAEIKLPEEKRYYPHQLFLEEHRKIHDKE